MTTERHDLADVASELGVNLEVEHDGCDLCYECEGCDGGSGATPRNAALKATSYGALLLTCLDCDGSGYQCPTQ